MQRLLNHAAPPAFLALFAIALAFIPWVAPPSAAELAEVGIGYVKADKAPLAHRAFTKALALDPHDFRANFGAGNLALDENKLAEAQSDLAMATKADPKNAEVAISLGVAYQKMGAAAQAEAAYHDAMRLEPKNPKPLYNMAFLEMQEGRYPAARADLQDYLNMAPNAPNKADVQMRIAQIDAFLKNNKKP